MENPSSMDARERRRAACGQFDPGVFESRWFLSQQSHPWVDIYQYEHSDALNASQCNEETVFAQPPSLRGQRWDENWSEYQQSAQWGDCIRATSKSKRRTKIRQKLVWISTVNGLPTCLVCFLLCLWSHRINIEIRTLEFCATYSLIRFA